MEVVAHAPSTYVLQFNIGAPEEPYSEDQVELVLPEETPW